MQDLAMKTQHSSAQTVSKERYCFLASESPHKRELGRVEQEVIAIRNEEERNYRIRQRH